MNGLSIGIDLSLFTRLTESFAPTDIPGLEAWWDAADEATITLNGSDVAQWDDKSANGRDLAQGTASRQPEYAATTINGKKVITFVPTNILERADFLIGLSAYTMIVVLKLPSGPQAFVAETRFAASGLDTFFQAASDGVESFRYFLRNETGNFDAVNGTAILFNDTPKINTFTDSGSEINSYVDGVADVVAFSYARSGVYVPDIFSVGGAYTLSTPIALINGEIAESLIYGRVLTSGEITQVENYLSDKWGI